MNIKERKFFILEDAKTDELVFFQYKDEAYQSLMKKFEEHNQEKEGLMLIQIKVPRMKERKEIQWRIKEVSWEEIFKVFYYKKIKELEKE